MGLVFADVEIVNAGDVVMHQRLQIGEEDIRQLTVNAMVDSGAIMLSFNDGVRQALGLDIIDVRPSQLADGSWIALPVAGPVIVRFAGRFCTTNALILPDDSETLLGAIPMEEMDLWIHPARGVLAPVHPEGPLMSLR